MNSQGSCLVLRWFHDGSDAASVTIRYESRGVPLVSTMVPRWFRRCKRDGTPERGLWRRTAPC
eukprot:1055014-Pyramimonas_sp.AAC.1